MSGFMSNMMENFVESKVGGGGNSYYNESETITESDSYSSANVPAPPQVPYPW
jgi:hypothetical protein